MLQLARELSPALPCSYKQEFSGYSPSVGWDTGLKQSYTLQKRFQPSLLTLFTITVLLAEIKLMCSMMYRHTSANNHAGQICYMSMWSVVFHEFLHFRYFALLLRLQVGSATRAGSSALAKAG